MTVGSVPVGSVPAGSVPVGYGSTGFGSTGFGSGGGASRSFRSKTRFSSVCAVSGSSGWNAATVFAPIRPAAVTALICGAAQEEAGLEVEAAARRRGGEREEAGREEETATHRPIHIDPGHGGL